MKHRDVPGSLGILESSDNFFLPIGQADCCGPDDKGNALFRLRVGGRQIEGLFHFVDSEFRPAG